jgi:acylphosphatase
MKKIACRRVVLEGFTSYAIQGRNFREKIEELVRTKFNTDGVNVTGKVSNLKNGQVEVIFCGKDSDWLEFLKKLGEWTKKDADQSKIYIREPKIYDYEVEDNSFSDFTIERSDELSEMVWALRGAGNRFVESTKALQKIEETLKYRDKKIAVGRLFSLNYELLQNIELITTPGQNKDRIELVALTANVENPAIPEKYFVHLLVQLYLQVKDFKRTTNSQDVDELKRKINKLLEIIKNELEQREEKL